jgi:hypothetical protein
MAILAIPITQMPAKYPSLPITANALDVVFTLSGADFADKAHWQLGGKDILIVHGGAGAITLTVESSADPYNRTGNITAYSIGIGEYAVFPQFQLAGWVDASGYLVVVASAADLGFLVLRLTD